MTFSVAGVRTVQYTNAVNRSSASGTPIAVSAPPELAVGHYYVVFVHAATLGANITWTASDGMVRLADLSPGRAMNAFGRYVSDATVLAELQATTFAPGSTATTRAGAIALALEGLDPAAPFTADSAWTVYTANTTSVDFADNPAGDHILWGAYATGATTTNHPVMDPVGGGVELGQVTSFNSPPGTYSEDVGTTSSGISSTVLGVMLGGTSVTLKNAASTSGSIGIGLAEAAPTGETRTATGGLSLTATATATGTPRATPRFLSVADLEQYGMGVPWAHRLGPWTEFSEDSGDRAVALGYQVLEFSAHITSDGVWYGLHDNNRNRTSETTGLPDANQETWATVSASLNTLNDTGGGKPYYKLTDFLDKFVVGQGRIGVVDPKDTALISGTMRSAFLDVLDAHGGPSKIVVKFSGNGLVAEALFNSARARGYTCWGYFYDTQLNDGTPSTYDNYHDNSDWIGMGLIPNLSQAEMDETLLIANGRPIVGHIAYSQANYDTFKSLVLASPNYQGQTWMVQTSRIDLVPAVGMPVQGGMTASGTGDLAVQETATASGGLTLSGTAEGVEREVGTTTGTLNLAGSAVAVPRGVTAGTGTVILSGTGAPVEREAGTGTGTLTLSGSAVPVEREAATSTGSLTLAGSGVLVEREVATATGTLTLSGSSVRVEREVAAGSGTLTLGGTSTHRVVVTSTGGLTLTGTSTSVEVERGTAAGTLTLGGSAVGVEREPVTSSGTLTLAGSAVGVGRGVATAAGALTLNGTASRVEREIATGTGVLTLVGTGSAAEAEYGTTAGVLTLSGTGTATEREIATGAGTLALSGAAAVAGGTQTRTASGTVALAGSSAIFEREFTTAGGVLVLAGSSTVREVETATGPGSLVLSGTADANVSGGTPDRTGSGVVSVVGVAVATARFASTASGALVLSGTAPIAGGTQTRTAAGSMVVGGTSTITTRHPRIATGVMALAVLVAVVVREARNAEGTLTLGGTGVQHVVQGTKIYLGDIPVTVRLGDTLVSIR